MYIYIDYCIACTYMYGHALTYTDYALTHRLLSQFSIALMYVYLGLTTWD